MTFERLCESSLDAQQVSILSSTIRCTKLSANACHLISSMVISCIVCDESQMQQREVSDTNFFPRVHTQRVGKK